MTTESQPAASSPPPPAGFWKIRHAVIGLSILAGLVILLMRACGDEESEQQIDSQANKPRQAIAVQIPASTQWPPPPQSAVSQQPGYRYAPPQSGVSQQPGYGYVPPTQPTAPQQPGYGYAPPVQQQPQAPVPAENNPWAVRSQPRSYGQYRSQDWGQPQPRQPQYMQPSTSSQYRPLESESTPSTTRAPVVQQPAQVYRPMAPYDRLSGSSFGAPGYPYSGAYPGYYGSGVYGVPGGGVYGPVMPGYGWPGYW
jgi:hypothetical protein